MFKRTLTSSSIMLWAAFATWGCSTPASDDIAIGQARQALESDALAVITTQAIAEASSQVDDYLAFKRQLRPTYLVTEHALETNPGETTPFGWADGVDLSIPITAEKANARADAIRSWLVSHHLEYGIRNVLLIGDPDSLDGDVPMKNFFVLKHYEDPDRYGSDIKYWEKIEWFCLSPDTAYSYDTCNTWIPRDDERRYIPSDYYYSNVDFVFPTDDEGDIWDIGAIDFSIPGLNVGRLPVKLAGPDPAAAVAAMDSVLAKFISYTSDTDVVWRKKAILHMHEQFPGRGDWAPFGEAIRTQIFDPNGVSALRLYLDYASPNCPGCVIPRDLDATLVNLGSAWAGWDYPACDSSLLGGSLCQQPKTDFGIVVWSSHGSPTGAIGTIDLLSPLDYVPYLDDSHPAFTASAGCQNGNPAEDNGVAASLLRNGSIAFLGATDNSQPFLLENPNPYFDTDYVSSHDVVYGFVYGLVTSEVSGGAALGKAREHLSSIVAALPDELTLDLDFRMWGAYDLLIFNLYGDPTIGLVNEVPQEVFPLLPDPNYVATLSAGETVLLHADDWPSRDNPYWTANVVISVNSWSGSPIPNGTLVVNGVSYPIGNTYAYYQVVDIPDQGPYSVQLSVSEATILELDLGNR